jgi:spore maturation protein CgeB
MNKNSIILFLCNSDELTRERAGYFTAFSKKLGVLCCSTGCADTHNQKDKTPSEFSTEKNLVLILHPDASPGLPVNLLRSPVPTACFLIDTYSGTAKRIKWSMLFDYAFVFHPGYEQMFQAAGHPRSVCLPHAVEADLFSEPELERIYEVGWVGRLIGNQYKTRRRYIKNLQRKFHMNDVNRHYQPAEMAQIYRQSKVVVNLSRDDYLQDANLRCFEAMAAGALLFTPYPTELTQLGFVENQHYISFINDKDLQDKIQYYLVNEQERIQIAQSGRDLVLSKHTYDCRVQTILEIIKTDNGQLFAPARFWSKSRVHFVYLHYFAKHLMLDNAIVELRSLRDDSLSRTIIGMYLIVKAFIRALQLVFVK